MASQGFGLVETAEQSLKVWEEKLSTVQPGTEEYAKIESVLTLFRSLAQPKEPEEEAPPNIPEPPIAVKDSTPPIADTSEQLSSPSTSLALSPSLSSPKSKLSATVPIKETVVTNLVDTLDRVVDDNVEEEKDVGDLDEFLETKYGRRWDSYTSTSQIDDGLLSQLSPSMKEWIQQELAGSSKLLEEEEQERAEVERKKAQEKQKEREREAFAASVQRVENVRQLQEAGMYQEIPTMGFGTPTVEDPDASASLLLSRSHTPSASSTCNFDLPLIYPKQDELDAMSESTRYPRTSSPHSVSASSVSGTHHSHPRPYAPHHSPFVPPTRRGYPPTEVHAFPPPVHDDYPVLGGPMYPEPHSYSEYREPRFSSTFSKPPPRPVRTSYARKISARYPLPPTVARGPSPSDTGTSYKDRFKSFPRGPSPGAYGSHVFVEPDERRKRERDMMYSLGLPSSTSQSGWDSIENGTAATPEFHASPPNPLPSSAWYVPPQLDKMPERSRSREEKKLPVEVQVVKRVKSKGGEKQTWVKVGQRAFENVLTRIAGRQTQRSKKLKQRVQAGPSEQHKKNLLKWYQKRTSAQQSIKQLEKQMDQKSKRTRERHRRAERKKEKREEQIHAKATKHLVALRERESDSKKRDREELLQRDLRHRRAQESLRRRKERARERRQQKKAAIEAARERLQKEEERRKKEEERKMNEKKRAAEAKKKKLLEQVKISVQAREMHLEEVRTRKRKGSLPSQGKGRRRKNRRGKKNRHPKPEVETIERETTTTTTTATPRSDGIETSCSPPSDHEGVRQNIRRLIAQFQRELLNDDRRHHMKIHLGHEGQNGSDLVQKVKSLWHRTKSQVSMILGRPEFRVDYVGPKAEHVPFDEDMIFEPFRDISRCLQVNDLDSMPLTCRALALRCCVFVTYLPQYNLKTSRVVIETLVSVCQSQQGMEMLLHRCSAQILEEFILQVQAYIRTPEPILRQKQNITGLTRIVCDMFSYSPPESASETEIERCRAMQMLLIRLLSSSTFWMKLGTACQRFIGSPPSPVLINEKSGELLRLMRCGLVVLACTRRYRHRMDELEEFVTAFHSSNGGGMFWLLSNLVQCAGGDSNPPSIHLARSFQISDEAILVASCALEFLMEAAMIRGELAQRLLLENEGESFHTLTILTQYCCSRFDVGTETLKQLTFNLVGFLGCCAFGNTTIQEMFQWGRTTNLIESLVERMPFYFLNSFRGQMVMIPTLISVTHNCPTNLSLLKKHMSAEHILKFLARFLDETNPNVPACLASRYITSEDEKEELSLRIPREIWRDCVAFYS